MLYSLKQDGFTILPNFIPNNVITKCLKLAKRNIATAASELSVTLNHYLSCTGRWGNASYITSGVAEILNQQMQLQLEQQLGLKLILKKSNIICKTAAIADAIPFHQDIAYNADAPYHFSVWLSLNDVDANGAPLRVVRSSHNGAIKPAVDFWYPYFESSCSNADIDNVISLPVTAGDIIIFNSKLWHGSDINYATKERFAYVTRWVMIGETFPYIPQRVPRAFGMFNCAQITEDILTKSLSLFNLQSQYNQHDQTMLIDIWIEFLKSTPYLLDGVEQCAIESLQQLDILNRACTLHDAGNISGQVYKNLWFNLLSYLNSKVNIVDIK